MTQNRIGIEMSRHNEHPGYGPLFSAVTAMVSPAHRMITRQPLYERIAPLELRPGVANLAQRIASRIRLLAERAAQRQALMRLDDRMLRDIGLERGQALAEWRKPFWRD